MHSELPWWSLIFFAPAYGIYALGNKLRRKNRKKLEDPKEKIEDTKKDDLGGA